MSTHPGLVDEDEDEASEMKLDDFYHFCTIVFVFNVSCGNNNEDVAATDLLPFANQCPGQEIRSLTDQSTARAH